MIGRPVDILRRSDLFRGLSADQVEKLVELSEQKSFADKDQIVGEDDRANVCYLVLKGRIAIEVRASMGEGSERVATLRSGDVFGELSLLDGYLRSATARADGPTEVLGFDTARLKGLMNSDTAIGYRIMHNIANVLASRVSEMNRQLSNARSDSYY